MVSRVDLPKLGFGTSTLHRLFSKDRAERLISFCIDKGFTHFDTARMYGDGFSESVLGRVLSLSRDCYSITTKFGIPANPVLNKFPLLIPPHRILKRFMRLSSSNPDYRQFCVNQVERSLHKSLRALKTDYIDFFLAHEPACCHLSDLIHLSRYLESIKNKGYIRSYGFAVSPDMALEIRKLSQFNYSTLQVSYEPSNTLLFEQLAPPPHFSFGYFRAYKNQNLLNPFEAFASDVKKSNSCILFSSLNYDHITKVSSLL